MKKKILTLFLAFAIMMTFMPSMAFADDTPITEGVRISYQEANADTPFVYAEPSLDSGYTISCTIENANGLKLQLNPDEEMYLQPGSYKIQFVIEGNTSEYNNYGFPTSSSSGYTYVPGVQIIKNNVIPEYPMYGCLVTNDPTGQMGQVDITFGKYIVVNLTMEVSGEDDNGSLGDVIKGVAVVGAIVAAAAVIGTVGTAVQKSAVAQKMAFKAQMQQKAAQKQAAAIKTVLKGVGVVASLASFGSSLRNLYGLNNFGFNQFGFNPFGLR